VRLPAGSDHPHAVGEHPCVLESISEDGPSQRVGNDDAARHGRQWTTIPTRVGRTPFAVHILGRSDHPTRWRTADRALMAFAGPSPAVGELVELGSAVLTDHPTRGRTAGSRSPFRSAGPSTAGGRTVRRSDARRFADHPTRWGNSAYQWRLQPRATIPRGGRTQSGRIRGQEADNPTRWGNASRGARLVQRGPSPRGGEKS